MKKFYKRLIFFTLLLNIQIVQSSNGQGWEWGKQSLNSGPIDVGYVTTDKFGNTFETSLSWGDSIQFGTLTIYNPTHNYQFIVTKTDSSGNFLWEVHTINTDGIAEYTNLVTDDTGNVYVLSRYNTSTCHIGSFILNNPSMYEMLFVTKISSDGTVLWSQNMGCFNITGTPDAVLSYLAIDSSNNIYISTYNSLPFSLGSVTITNDSGNVYLMKLNSAGIPVWGVSYGGHLCDITSEAISVAKNGNIYCSFRFQGHPFTIGPYSFPSYLDCFNNVLVKFNTDGALQWAKSLDTNIQYISNSCLDYDENIYLTGGFHNSLNVGPDSLISNGGYDILFEKFDSTGQVKWAKGFGASGNESGYVLSSDNCGKIFLCGSMDEYFARPNYTIYFDSSVISDPPGSVGPMFIAEFDTTGNYILSTSLPIGASSGEVSGGLSLDNIGNCYIWNIQNDATIIFNYDTLSNPGPYNARYFLAKFKYDSFSCQPYCVPTSIVGSESVCLGSSVTLGDPTPSGSWSSANTSIATIDPTISIVTGLSLGTTTITYYEPLGCFVTKRINVVPTLPAIFGTTHVCEGYPLPVTLSDTAGFGRWSSGNDAIAKVDSLTGYVTGIAGGTVLITYSLGGTCFDTIPFEVGFIPPPISGIRHECQDWTTTFSDSVSGGIWTSTSPIVASVDSFTGVITGLMAYGVVNILYTLPNGCVVELTDTVLSCPVNTKIYTKNNLLNIYPNPASTLLNIEATGFTSFTIFNTLGQELFTKKITEQLTTVDIQHFNPGLYYLSFAGEGQSLVKKFLKE